MWPWIDWGMVRFLEMRSAKQQSKYGKRAQF